MQKAVGIDNSWISDFSDSDILSSLSFPQDFSPQRPDLHRVWPVNTAVAQH